MGVSVRWGKGVESRAHLPQNCGMKIGLVRRGFSATGGAEAYLRRFAAASSAVGHSCVLFTTDQWPEDQWDQQRVEISGTSPQSFADALRHSKPRSHCDWLLSLERVWECDAYRAGDGVHADWLDQRAQYEPFWKTWTRGFNSKHEGILKLESTLLAERAAGLVIANSRMVKSAIQKRYRYPAERIHVVYNGLPAHPAPDGAREQIRGELKLANDDYVLVFGGSGWERKGLKFAVQALRKSPGATLVVAGRGDPSSMPNCSRVRYLGPRSDMPSVLAAADVFILPTLYEPFSNACLEALGAGLPVITTVHNGFGEIIRAGTQGEVLSEPSDIGALVEAIRKWSDADRRVAIREQLMELARRFSMERNVQETLALVR